MDEATPASRAGVSEEEYRAWASGAQVEQRIIDAIKAAAPNEPGYCVTFDKHGNPKGLREIPAASAKRNNPG